MTEKTKTRLKIPKPIVVVGAWVTVAVVAIVSVVLALFLTGIFLSEYDEQTIGFRFVIAFGFFGLQLLLFIVFILFKYRKRTYVQQLLVGTIIGTVLYSIFFVGGAISFIAQTATNISSTDAACSAPIDQYRSYGAAIVPIETDTGIGSGVIVDDKGTVLTAHHVISGAKEIYANYSTGKIAMSVINTAEQYDLALLKLEKYESTHFSLATNYNDGDDVLAYGYPHNALTAGSPTITKGIVSRVLTIADLRMTLSDLPDGLEYIQTDAAINPGNSGGALIGSCGLIGIVVAVSDSAQVSDYVGAVSEQGISFAVSTKTAAQAFGLHIAHE